MTANARLWCYENGAPVKLTLRDGHPLSWDSSAPTDEGWSSEGFEIWLDLDTVYREHWTDGVDCDGRLSTSGKSACHVSRLAAHHVATCPECHNLTTHTGIGAEGGPPAEFCRCCGAKLDWGQAESYPDWASLESSQRDYQAEAAGY